MTSNKQILLAFTLLGSGVLLHAAPAPFPAEFDPATIEAGAGRKLTDTSNPLFADSSSVQAVGDTDGDGYDDYLFMIDTNNDQFSDKYYLIKGSASIEPLNLSQLQAADGIELADAATFQGIDLGPAGDVNGDGLADWWAKQEGEQGSELKLIFGREDGYPSPFLLGSTIAGEGVRFLDLFEEGLLYSQIHPVGDFNGDGFDDLAFLTVDDSLSQAFWDLRLVYGASSLPAVVDVRELPDSQVTRFGVRFQSPLAGGGDVNGDGYDDIVAYRASHVYVIYGAPEGLPDSIDDSARDGSRGFTIFAGDDSLQGQVGIAGDLNGDALDDVFISSGRSSDVNGVYIIYGAAGRQSPLLELELLTEELGYKVTMEPRESNDIVDRVGDVNGDSLDDLLLGNNLIYGSSIPLGVGDVSRLNGVNGFTVADGSSSVVWPAGDTNGDGVDDFIVNTPDDDVSYLVFGREADARQPASPNNVRAALGANLIELRWDASVSERLLAYEVARDGVVLGQQGANFFYFEDTSAQRDVLYTYEVSAVDLDGRYSEPVAIVVQNDEPLYPSISGDVYSSTLAEIFWSYANVQYNIYRDGELVDTRYAGSYVDRDYMPEGHSYVVEVAGNADTRETVRSPTLRLPVAVSGSSPSTPANFRVLVYSSTAAELFWERSTGDGEITGYEIRRNGVSLGVFDVLSFFEDGLTEGVSYEYSISAVDFDGNRSQASTLSFVAGDKSAVLPTNVPPAANLHAEIYSSSAIELFWNREASQYLRYEIWRDGRVLGMTDGTSYFIDNLVEGQSYTFEVQALNSEDARSDSVVIQVNTTSRDSDDAPAPPENTSVQIYSTTAAELFWTNADEVESVEIYRNAEYIDTSFGNSYFDDARPENTNHIYSLASLNASGQRSELIHIGRFETAKLETGVGLQALNDYGSISLSSGTVVLPADRQDTDMDGSLNGAVYLFTRAESGEWSLLQTIFSDENAGRFGMDAAIDGNTLAISQRDNGDIQAEPGQLRGVTLYSRDVSRQWRITQRLSATTDATAYRFGDKIAIDGDTMMIRAVVGSDSDIVFVYHQDESGQWTQQQTLTLGDDDTGLGSAMDIDGDTAIIGDYRDPTNGFLSGAAWIYNKDSSGNWMPVQQLQPDTNVSGDRIGSSVALEGDTAILAGERSDQVYIYSRSNDDQWALSQVIDYGIDDRVNFDDPGTSVGLDEGKLVIGVSTASELGRHTGAAYVYEKRDDIWVKTETLAASNGKAEGLFGEHIAVDNGYVAVSGTPPFVEQVRLRSVTGYLFELD